MPTLDEVFAGGEEWASKRGGSTATLDDIFAAGEEWAASKQPQWQPNNFATGMGPQMSPEAMRGTVDYAAQSAAEIPKNLAAGAWNPIADLIRNPQKAFPDPNRYPPEIGGPLNKFYEAIGLDKEIAKYEQSQAQGGGVPDISYEPEASTLAGRFSRMAGGVLPLAGEIVLLNQKVLPASWGPIEKAAAAFAIEAQINGEDPVKGALTGLAFGTSGVAAGSLGKAGKLAAESATMAGVTAAHGGNTEETFMAGMLPTAIKIVDALPAKVRNTIEVAKALREKDPVLADKIARTGTASRTEAKRAGLTEETSVQDRELLAKVVAREAEAKQFAETAEVMRGEQPKPEPKLSPKQVKELEAFGTPERPAQPPTQEAPRGQEVQAQAQKVTPEPPGAGPATPAPEAADLSALSWPDLKAKAKEAGVPVRGTKAQLVERLTTVSAGTSGVTAQLPSMGDVWDSAKSLAQRYLTSRGHLPQEVFDRFLQMKGAESAEVARVEQSLSDLKRAAKEELGSSKLSDASIKAVDDAMRTTTPSPNLPPKMQAAVTKMRDHVDALGEKLIQSGAVTAQQASIIQANKGEYLHRSYRVFDDPKWSKKVSKAHRDYAEQYLARENPTWTPDEIKGYIDHLLFEGKAADSPVGFLKGRMAGQKDVSILKERFLPEELRPLYGEYRDPGINFARSATKIAHLVESHKFLEDVRQMGLNKFLFEKPLGKHIAEIAPANDPTMKPLAGLYTTPEIKATFERMFSRASGPAWLEAYTKLNGTVKVAKTVLSAMTGIRNFLSNHGFALASGNFHVSRFGSAIRTTLADLGIKDSAAWRAKVVEARKYGVLGQSARAGELRALGKDAFTGDTGKKIVEAPAKLYGAEDDVWKVYAWENEQIKYRKAYPNWTDAQIKTKAAEIVRNTHPTYSMLPEGVRGLRQFPLVGTFVSFPAEVLRVGHNLLKLTGAELADPATRSIGVQRVLGTVAAAALGTVATKAAMARLGITSDQDEDIRNFMPEWSQNSEIMYIGRDKRDATQWRYVDLSFSDPWNVIKKPLMAMARGEDWQEGLFDAVAQLAEPFLGEEILAAKLMDVQRNVTAQGKQIYNPQADWLTQSQQKLAHIWEAFEPGTVSQLRRIKYGFEGVVGPSGKSYYPRIETTAMLTGQRISEIDVPQAMQFKAVQFNKAMQDAQRMLNTVLSRRGSVTDAEIQDAYEQAETSRKRIWQEMQSTVSAARRLGMSESAIASAIENGGVSKTQRRAVVSGQYREYALSDQMKAALRKRGLSDRIDKARSARTSQ